MAKVAAASRRRIDGHWDVLCDQIGCREAGSKGEQAGADYVERQFRGLGLANVRQEPFKFPNWKFTSGSLKVGKVKPTRRIATAKPAVHSPSTAPKGVRGKLAFLQAGLPMDFAQPLRGKIGLVMGSLSFSDKKLQQCIRRSGLKALIQVDPRCPFGWTTSVGCAPHWVGPGHLPAIGVSYLDAIDLVEQMPLNVHLTVAARTFPDTSQNVFGEIIGTHRPDEVIVVSGHHDCVHGNVGADDNGSGVIFALELARIFAKRKPKRTIRFASYGVEERLSIGSYLHMRSLKPAQRKQIVFALNADGGAATMGYDVVRVTGTPALEKLARGIWDKRKHPAQISSVVNPYSDHFPMNMIGAPSVDVTRISIPDAAAWHLHSEYDNPAHVSSAVLARTIDTAAVLLRRVADAPRLPFPRKIEPSLARQVRSVARIDYCHPWSPKDFQYPT